VKTFLYGFVVALVATMPAWGQEAEVQRYLTMVSNGQTEEVRRDIPSLLTRYPNDPGVLYLQAQVTKEGAEAARIYQSVVDNFPRSKWADASLFRVYQFYYALGLYRTAEIKLTQLKKEYPGSKYLATVSGAEPANLPEEEEGAQPPAVRTQEPPAPAQADKPSVQPAPTARPPAAELPRNGVAPTAFTLQVGAFSTQANAEKQKQFFENLGYPVEVISKMRDTRMLFVVLVGTYASYDEAKGKGGEIKKKHSIDSMVVPK
jgi:cell division septation protein DedD